jgi:hypothetical protein
MRQVPNANRPLDDHVLRALNRIKKPSTAEEITELLNRDLGPGDQAFSGKRSCGLVAKCRPAGAELVLAGKIGRAGSPPPLSMYQILAVGPYISRRCDIAASFARMSA